MSALPERHDESLDDAIRQLINLGERDPITIAQRLASMRGGDWIAAQLAAHWEEIIAEAARQMIGNERRSAVRSLSTVARERQGGKVSKRDLMLTTLFVPKDGYVAFGEATPAQVRVAAAYRRALADGLLVWADWLDASAALAESENASAMKRVKSPLPELPSKDVPPEIGA